MFIYSRAYIYEYEKEEDDEDVSFWSKQVWQPFICMYVYIVESSVNLGHGLMVVS